MKTASLLIVDDEEGMRKSLSILFKKEGYQVYQAESGKAALEYLAGQKFDLVVTDLCMDAVSGTDVLHSIRENRIPVPVIIMTAYGTIESAVSAMKAGACDYITKPFEYEEILHRAERAIGQAETEREMNRMSRARAASSEDFSMIIGESPLIRGIRTQLRKIAANSLPVLMTGETGTGKNLFAKVVHLNSPRAGGPFLSVNCTSIPEHLIESELFGHTKGAFTGAIMERKGLFEAAHGGTILLDEIGDIPKTIQAKLLGVLQEKTIRRVGSNEEIPVDTRVIAATNTDLIAAIKRGDFREDLYYRINVLHAHIPPLRERKEDIPLLSESFLSLCASDQDRQHIVGFTSEAIDRLYHYEYPGNVRELYNIICHAVAVSDSPLVGCEDMPSSLRQHAGCSPVGIDESAPMDIKEWERKIILRSIERHPSNLAEVCRELKIGRTTLWRKMKQYKIEVSSSRHKAS
ncbi:MAG: sigma-54 dependent transcriptional regulator [Thermodesulfovibrionales bacterium]